MPPPRKVEQAPELKAQQRSHKGAKLQRLIELPIYDSMEQCSAATGVPLEVLKQAKKNGCLFVRHGRVDFAVFLRWFFNEGQTDDGESKINWSSRDKRAAALLKEAKLEEYRKQVIDFNVVTRFVDILVRNSFFAELDRMAQEYPSLLKGKDEIPIHEECMRRNASIKKALVGWLDKWVKTKGKV